MLEEQIKLNKTLIEMIDLLTKQVTNLNRRVTLIEQDSKEICEPDRGHS